jgi:hypothetical protein
MKYLSPTALNSVQLSGSAPFALLQGWPRDKSVSSSPGGHSPALWTQLLCLGCTDPHSWSRYLLWLPSVPGTAQSGRLALGAVSGGRTRVSNVVGTLWLALTSTPGQATEGLTIPKQWLTSMQPGLRWTRGSQAQALRGGDVGQPPIHVWSSTLARENKSLSPWGGGREL